MLMTDAVRYRGPLLTADTERTLRERAAQGGGALTCSLDLQRTQTQVQVDAQGWTWREQRFAFAGPLKADTVYYWADDAFSPVARFGRALVKLRPTSWGPPTFEIDGVKMLPSADVSPYADAQRKVALIKPQGKVVLDTCGGLGYFGAWCIEGGAGQVLSFEKNEDVLWLRCLNPWSPATGAVLTLTHGDVHEHIGSIGAGQIDAVLHDPPRFALAGELYSLAFYLELVRVLRRGGMLFHYTGQPNRLTTGRDVPREVARRLQQAGFQTQLRLDGVLARKM